MIFQSNEFARLTLWSQAIRAGDQHLETHNGKLQSCEKFAICILQIQSKYMNRNQRKMRNPVTHKYTNQPCLKYFQYNING